MRRILAFITLVLATGGLLGFTAAAASADGNGAQTTTQHFKNATNTFVDFVPCRSFRATITITYNGVLHFTVNKAGDFWATGTMTGTVRAVPLNPRNPSFTGKFTSWFGTSDNKQNGVDHSTFTTHATGSDGSTIKFHDTAHLSTNASGNGLTVSFDKARCG
jgi:hypothetical protein